MYTIHSNGTSAEELRDQYLRVAAGAEVLEENLRAAAPMVRDYYTMPNWAEEYAADRLYYVELLRYVEAIKAWGRDRAIVALAATQR